MHIYQFLSPREACIVGETCKTWHRFYKNIFHSYYYFRVIDTLRLSEVELDKVLKKCVSLSHIQKLRDIVKNDFGGKVKNLYRRLVLKMSLADSVSVGNKHVLLDKFKVKPRESKDENFNFLSNKSVENICVSSKFSLREVALRNCLKLTDKIEHSLSQCFFLESLDLSYTK